MAEYRLTPRADLALRQIWRSIAPDSQKAADALLLQILDKLERAAHFPEIGARRPELSPTARLLVEGRYVVIYEPMVYGVLVVAIVHSRREPSTWLD